MSLSVTPWYAAALALLFLALSLQVVRYRRGHRVSLGDAGDPALLARIRAHGNCAEYAPMGLLLLLVAELSGTSPLWLHLLGLMLLGGRLAHAAGLSFFPRRFGLRTAGMLLTFAALALGAVLAVL